MCVCSSVQQPQRCERDYSSGRLVVVGRIVTNLEVLELHTRARVCVVSFKAPVQCVCVCVCLPRMLADRGLKQ